MTYDSRPDTLFHSITVGQYMMKMLHEALDRALVHDLSKTETPEVEVFDKVTPLLKALTYGTPEYSASLASMGPALQHHYFVNRHHPEHFDAEGINGMTLVDLIEMLADWKAATLRMQDGNLARSLTIQKQRFGISDQLMDILRNTAVRFEMVSPTDLTLEELRVLQERRDAAAAEGMATVIFPDGTVGKIPVADVKPALDRMRLVTMRHLSIGEDNDAADTAGR